ncbi:ArsR family transcriptional regulator [Occultella glacieicola]|uniref:ArsR family transcriptional regulator n=1 Tax=Occultella glacieicola TaxID=2518684 RepID=A0ABY2DYQ8_9MICO|nr:helix-turn-helix transcriptional regulator [Occultella glacieicola]TDE88159.1 ArsR family transcriptional regulator [Occultella glacieicola]
MPAYVQPPLPETVEMAIEAFGNRVRVAILAHLAKTDAATSREIADALDLSIRPAQRHVWYLEEIGLVDVDQPGGDRRGTRPRYSLNRRAATRLYEELGQYIGLSEPPQR